MIDREKTHFLTKVGFLVLKRMKCYAIGTEIWMFRSHVDLSNEMDRHSLMDLVGIQREYPRGQPSRDILRGIEVKVSRSDFKRGFIHSGCTFNYLMVPKGLVKPKELKNGVGLVEVDIPSFSLVKHRSLIGGFAMSGVNVARAAKRKPIEQRIMERCTEQIATALTCQVKRWLLAAWDQKFLE